MNLAASSATAPAAPIPVTSPAAAAPARAPLAPVGLRLPKVPGLPDWNTPGAGLERLAGPPAPGSLAARADMAMVKGAQLLRTRAGDEWARRLDADGGSRLWFDMARRHRDTSGVAAGWLGTALLAGTLAANATVTQLAKRRFDRPRPYEVDPSIVPAVPLPRDRSYPSGHASSAYAAARVIATLRPELAREAYDLARQVAVSRVYAGVHFPSDVVAGALLGTAVAESVLRRSGRRPAATPAS